MTKNHWEEAAKDVFASVIGSASCVYTGQPFGRFFIEPID